MEVVKLDTKHDTYSSFHVKRPVTTQASSWTMICGRKASDTGGLNLRVPTQPSHDAEIKVVQL